MFSVAKATLRHGAFKFAKLIERGGAIAQGKGLGSSVAQEVRQALQFCSAEGVFIDVGGNKGDYAAAILSHLPSARVLIYEPSALNVSALRERFEGFPNVSIYDFGLGDEDLETLLFSDYEGSGLGSLVKRRLDHFERSFDFEEVISTKRFFSHWTSELGSPAIALCKIDVEGLEMKVLEGFGEALGSCGVIQFEFGGTHIDARCFFQDFWYFFKDHGFDLFRISPLGPMQVLQYEERDEYFAGPSNFLAVRRSTGDT